MDVSRVHAELLERLRAAAQPERAEGERRYLKSHLRHLGTGVPAARRAAVALHRAARPGHDDLVALVEALWAEPLHEARLAAIELLVLGVGELDVADAPLLERLLRACRTWALVDPLAIGVVGALRTRDPDAWAPVLGRWVGDEDHWIRRSALLAHLRGVRAEGPNGAEAFRRFGEHADALLADREFFIRKAIGWVLRDAGRRHPDLVVAWLLPRAPRAAGLTVREAVKHLSEADRQRILALRE